MVLRADLAWVVAAGAIEVQSFASGALGTLATARLELKGRTDADVSAAVSWLGKRGVAGVVRFPVMKFGSDNAPERRAMSGEMISAQSTA